MASLEFKPYTNEEIENEKWLPIVGFRGMEVSDLGRVRSWRKRGGQDQVSKIPTKDRSFATKPRFVKLVKNKRGYLTVCLYESGKQETRTVHYLVVTTFIGPKPSPKSVIRHFPDDCFENNRLSNLQWGTQKENVADKKFHGTITRGTDTHTNVLSEDQVRRIAKKLLLPAHERPSQKAIAKSEGIEETMIKNIKFGRNWTQITGFKLQERNSSNKNDKGRQAILEFPELLFS